MKTVIALLTISAGLSLPAFASKANQPAPSPLPSCQHNGPYNVGCIGGATPGQVAGAGGR